MTGTGLALDSLNIEGIEFSLTPDGAKKLFGKLGELTDVIESQRDALQQVCDPYSDILGAKRIGERRIKPENMEGLEGKQADEIVEMLKSRLDKRYFGDEETTENIIQMIARALTAEVPEDVLDSYVELDRLNKMEIDVDRSRQMIDLGSEVLLSLNNRRDELESMGELHFDESGKVTNDMSDIPIQLRVALQNWQQLLANARAEKGRGEHPFSRLIAAFYALEADIGEDRFEDELRSIARNCYSEMTKGKLT